MIFSLAFRNLTRNFRRTLAMVLTIGIGTGALLVFKGFNVGIMNQYRDNTIHARYGHGQINMKGYHNSVYEKPWKHWIEDYSSLKENLKTVEGVKYLFPRVSFFSLLTNGEMNISGKGQGINGINESKFFHSLNIVDGKNLSNEKEGILLGKGLARALNAKIGDRITVLGNTIYGSMNAVDTYVTGIFHTGSKEFDDSVFRIQLDLAHTLLDTKKVESISLGMTGLGLWKNIEDFVDDSDVDLESISFPVLDKVYYQHSVDWLDAQFGVIQIIILVIVILGIFNTVSTAILERRQEVGNLRANGESQLEVLKLFSNEGFLVGVFGALFGIFIIYAINLTILKDGILMPPAPGLTRQFHVKIELQTWMAVQTFFIGVVTSSLATFLASLRVINQKISDLLRSV